MSEAAESIESVPEAPKSTPRPKRKPAAKKPNPKAAKKPAKAGKGKAGKAGKGKASKKPAKSKGKTKPAKGKPRAPVVSLTPASAVAFLKSYAKTYGMTIDEAKVSIYSYAKNRLDTLARYDAKRAKK